LAVVIYHDEDDSDTTHSSYRYAVHRDPHFSLHDALPICQEGSPEGRLEHRKRPAPRDRKSSSVRGAFIQSTSSPSDRSSGSAGITSTSAASARRAAESCSAAAFAALFSVTVCAAAVSPKRLPRASRPVETMVTYFGRSPVSKPTSAAEVSTWPAAATRPVSSA